MRAMTWSVALTLAAAATIVAWSPLAAQTPSSASTEAPGACSLLTKELVTRVTPLDKQALDLVMQLPPDEEPVGPGSYCEYGSIGLEIDPFERPATVERQLDKEWAPLPDVADAAYFRDNKGRWAELYARAGGHVFTIQMSVPTGRTTESIKPNVIALAKAIVSKLQ
jgi:hypothetical protein